MLMLLEWRVGSDETGFMTLEKLKTRPNCRRNCWGEKEAMGDADSSRKSTRRQREVDRTEQVPSLSSSLSVSRCQPLLAEPPLSGKGEMGSAESQL